MIGTVLIGAAFLLGFWEVPMWWIVPVALASNFVGIHTPPERVQMLRERGVSYWRFFFSNLPLISLVTAAFYGGGYVLQLAL